MEDDHNSQEGGDMTTFLIVVLVTASIYVFAAVAFYYSFKKWPM